MTDALGQVLTPERLENMYKTTPMGAAWASPRIIANAALFMVSPAASWITGLILGVNGGV